MIEETPRNQSPKRMAKVESLKEKQEDLVNPKVQEFITLIDLDKCKTEDIDAAFNAEEISLDDHHFLTTFLAKVQEKDDLTGLVRRNFLESKLNDFCREIDSGNENRKDPIQAVQVMYIDIDSFKKINDEHSHEVGDLAIKAVADRLRYAVRTEDIVARMGGDEFAIIQPVRGADMPNIEDIKTRIRENLSIDTEDGKINLGISIGHVVKQKGDNNPSTASELFHAADAEMYKNKNRLI